MFKKINSLKVKWWYKLFSALLFLGIVAVQYLTIEISVQNLTPILKISFMCKLIGVSTVFFLNVLLLLILKNVRATLNITSTATSVLSIINFYVYKFHGNPINLDLIRNIGTAMDVIGTYEFNITLQVFVIILSALFQLAVINIFLKDISCKRIVSSIVSVMLAVFMIQSYFVSNPAIPKNIVNWTWSGALRTVGYVPSLVQNSRQFFDAVQKPENYDESEIKDYIQKNITESSGATPDIIIILNETFYDLSQITEINVDNMSALKNLENSIQGYAVCPGVGGGTNNSEYELLTSNSLVVAPNITPFNNLVSGQANSIASYAKAQGYSTLAVHCGEPDSYNRNRKYPLLGFDKMLFNDSFENLEYYADRPGYATDSSVYREFKNFYENMGEQPRFAYLLTIQNHGGYEFNDEKDLIIKSPRDYEKTDHMVDEFLSCIELSSEAFVELTTYFENSDRDVIVCMVGDHAPSIAKDIVDEKYLPDAELLLRSVPYIVWSNNIDLTGKTLPERLSMAYMVPSALGLTDMELSGYYKYINDMKNDIPVISSYGKYITKDGNIYSYDETTEHSDVINRYFDFCYANMKEKTFMIPFTQ